MLLFFYNLIFLKQLNIKFPFSDFSFEQRTSGRGDRSGRGQRVPQVRRRVDEQRRYKRRYERHKR